MKKIKVKTELCIGCLVCEETCSSSLRKEKNEEKSAIRIEADGERDYKVTVCDQCGKCIDACPAEAIYRDKKGIVRIKKDTCVGCLACVAACPTGAMFYHDDYLEPFKCIVCGLCAKECPSEAIFVEEN